MKIAIVAPSPVPYTVGGAEKLWWGLLHHMNQTTAHQIELIKLPSPERTFWELVQSYRQFSELNLDHFDMILSTKYPAWMVSHPNHHCYLQHKLRGLYDTYHFCRQPTELPGRMPKALHPLRDIITSSPDRRALAALWEVLDTLKPLANEDEHIASLLAFPGPVSRRLIHFLDDIALQPGAIQRYHAISRNVAQRADYFPEGVPVQVVHHPSDVTDFKNTGYDYLFTISRLDGAKRIRMLIEAFKATRTEREFRIAGTGPEEAALRELAADDPRIRFLGRITDQEVVGQYAGALFVPFIPYDEDYGLITIEAMGSGKAVLTTTDAGGVNEFVVPGETGLSVPPEVPALTEAMQTLLDAPEETRQMGERAREKVRHITWTHTIRALLPEHGISAAATSAAPPDADKKEILVVVNFPVYPPRGGGQSRIYHLYKALSRQANVTLLTQCGREQEAGVFVLGDGYREVRLTKSPGQKQREQALAQTLHASVDDIAAIEGVLLSPEYEAAFRTLSATADLVIASHPYLFQLIEKHYTGPLWYEAHNVEYDMKAAVLRQAGDPLEEHAQQALETVRCVERDCIEAADVLMACSEEDIRRFEALYACPGQQALLVPNGVCLDSVPFTAWSERIARQQRLGTADRFQVLFMGSWHGPNIEAMEWIGRYAQACPKVDFLVIGTVCNHPNCKKLPPNVHPLGMVTDEEKAVLLSAVDLAINPMLSGSGTNLKMLDYAASGTPILTTPFGNRGLMFEPGTEIICAGADAFAPEILRRCEEKQKAAFADTEALVMRAFNKCKTYYDWNLIAGKIVEQLRSGIANAD